MCTGFLDRLLPIYFQPWHTSYSSHPRINIIEHHTAAEISAVRPYLEEIDDAEEEGDRLRFGTGVSSPIQSQGVCHCRDRDSHVGGL